MSNDSTSRSGPPNEYTAPRTAPPAMYCAECKAILRLAYFSLDGRPLCTACANAYRARIERGKGPGSMGRAVLYGTGAAIAGMIGVGLVLSLVNSFRIFCGIGVAYLVAKAIGKATGNYGGRRYQILAVVLTYLSLGLAMLVPVFRAANELASVKAPPKVEARTGGAGEQAAIQEEMASIYAAPREGEDSATVAARADSIAAADSAMRLERTRANVMARDGNAKMAGRLAGSGLSMLIGALTLLVVLPLVSSFSYGLYVGVIGLFALGFAMKKAWELTDLVMDFELTGPYKVGQGPIAPTIGG